MAFGEEARLLMMRVLQNFVRANRGKWDDQAWHEMIVRVRRLGFDTITDERMLQLATDNRERWLAGENGVGPPPPVSAPITPVRIVPPPVVSDIQSSGESEPTPAPSILDAVGMSGMATTEVVECGGGSESLEVAVAAEDTEAAPVAEVVAEAAAPGKPKPAARKKAKKKPAKKKPAKKKPAKKKPAKKKARKAKKKVAKKAKKKAKKKVAKKKVKKAKKKKAKKKVKKAKKK